LEARLRVFVVDDEEPIRAALCAALAAAGHEAVPAPDGERALAALGESAPDVVVLDLLMPGMNGVATLKAMREAGYGGPAIVLTGMGKGAQALLAEAAALGASKHLKKPFKLTEVLAAVVEVGAKKEPAPAAGPLDAAALVRAMPIPACLTDTDGNVLGASPSFGRLLREGRSGGAGGKGAGLSRVLAEELIPPEVVEEAFARGSVWFRSVDAATGSKAELRVVTVADGLLLWLFSEQRLFPAGDSKRRMEALVQLAGGLAHELNNPLGGISAQAQLLREALGDAAPALLQHLDLIESGAARAASVVEGLLLFAGQVGLERSVCSVEAVLREALDGLGPAAIRVKLEVGEGLPEVFWDKDKVVRALRALADNAFRAAGKTGRIFIGAGLAAPGVVRLFVRDEGPGIPAEDLERVVEPFYTTRRVNEGMGLGLCIAWGIAGAHGGRLGISSGAGTLVTLELPSAVPAEGGV